MGTCADPKYCPDIRGEKQAESECRPKRCWSGFPQTQNQKVDQELVGDMQQKVFSRHWKRILAPKKPIETKSQPGNWRIEWSVRGGCQSDTKRFARSGEKMNKVVMDETAPDPREEEC